MNFYGSYRKLRDNSISAMIAAIEIYNKPRFSYRKECFAILAVNSWELLLKAVLSKNKQIYYKKKRNESYRTISISDCVSKVERYLPKELVFQGIKENLLAIVLYRDTCVHYYNEKGFEFIIWGLAQACIMNYSNTLKVVFNRSLANQIDLHLLPLSTKPMIDPISYLSVPSSIRTGTQAHIFLHILRRSLEEMEKNEIDPNLLSVCYKIKLESVKKGNDADITAVSSNNGSEKPNIAERRVDPNVTHPLRTKDVLEELQSRGVKLHSRYTNKYIFQVLVDYLEIKKKKHLCWVSNFHKAPHYSKEVVSVIAKLTLEEVDEALEERKKVSKKG